MSIEYSFVITQVEKTKADGLNGEVSHVHFNYVGTDAAGRTSFCQGILPFQIKELVLDTPDGDETIASVLDPNNFIPEPTNEQLISWLEQQVPSGAIATFQSLISERIAQMES